MADNENNKYEEMKTSELLDEIYERDENISDVDLVQMDEEIQDRSPFDYYEEKIKELLEKVEKLEKQFKKHKHQDGKVVLELDYEK